MVNLIKDMENKLLIIYKKFMEKLCITCNTNTTKNISLRDLLKEGYDGRNETKYLFFSNLK